VSADIIPFPPQGKKCKTCGFVMIPTAGEAEHEKCFCCRNTLPLPLSQPAAPGDPCRECAGTGHVSVHVCRNEKECLRKCPQQQECVACLGQGLKG
jgi:hypothetical protein